jgi:hypothetical protein
MENLVDELTRRTIASNIRSRAPHQGCLIAIPNWEHLEVKVAASTPYKGDRTKIFLDWGEHGDSYVWLHDEGKTWSRKSPLN